jgi:hypothetical protein
MTTTSGDPNIRPSPSDRPGQSPKRQVRIPDTAYYPAVARAKRDGTSIGHVVTELLAAYARGDITP